MKKISLFALMVFFIGCASSLQDYQPKSADETEIKSLLLEWQTAWNNQDVPKVMACLHDNARVMYGRERMVATKKEYEAIIGERMAAAPMTKMGSPIITINGDKAQARMTSSAGGRTGNFTLDFLRDKGKWLIAGWKY